MDRRGRRRTKTRSRRGGKQAWIKKACQEKAGGDWEGVGDEDFISHGWPAFRGPHHKPSQTGTVKQELPCSTQAEKHPARMSWDAKEPPCALEGRGGWSRGWMVSWAARTRMFRFSPSPTSNGGGGGGRWVVVWRHFGDSHTKKATRRPPWSASKGQLRLKPAQSDAAFHV